ncbi:hypothetical protein CYMTET_50438 [Cymbomonas tetramitiformis]|uniref:Uncharacterized protein n=1 Tax=Cymbomonas tetramitiformis TaxID=36881 RepID=A0AAE0BPR3_9CHLO|nr:hypothetical protein CYMTET_50438 [Cymbomonas tetramitiformis]
MQHLAWNLVSSFVFQILSIAGRFATVAASIICLIFLGLLGAAASSSSIRESIALGPLGLSAKRAKPHGLLRVSEFATWQDYTKTLKRSCTQTLDTVDKKLQNSSITMITRKSEVSYALANALDIMKVIFSHERRVYPLGKAISAAITRWFGTACLLGTLDMYYSHSQGKRVLVGFSHTVVKGDTLRGMWFYQKAEYSRCGIWFHSIKTAVERGIRLQEVNFVDVGPSYNGGVADMKEKYGFQNSSNWREMCQYDGPYLEIVPAS